MLASLSRAPLPQPGNRELNDHGEGRQPDRARNLSRSTRCYDNGNQFVCRNAWAIGSGRSGLHAGGARATSDRRYRATLREVQGRKAVRHHIRDCVAGSVALAVRRGPRVLLVPEGDWRPARKARQPQDGWCRGHAEACVGCPPTGSGKGSGGNAGHSSRAA